ncbi:MAG: cytochrome c3 family protein [Rhodocyclales bacterium]|nr:cytochrome c3 family protein [Rhodocyclales bacterium]
MNANNLRTKHIGRHIVRWLGAATVAAMMTGAALAAGISSTKHNLSSGGSGETRSGKSSTDQICVFCHTPHGSDTSAPVPLWNRKLDTSTSYTLFSSLGTSTLDGEVLSVGSISLACLSCHDGTQAMDSVINAPGSGGYNSAGARFGTWTAGATGGTAGIIGTAGNPIPRLGTDLSDDHPIGIAYCGGGLTGTGSTASGTCADTDFIGTSATTTADGRAAQVKTAVMNSQQVFWVDVDANTGRGKGDIQLYTRDFAGAAGTPSVECGSCHDPHVESSASGLNFMRVATSGSQICLSCHVK